MAVKAGVQAKGGSGVEAAELAAFATSVVGGGTNDIQRALIARGLGLPR